VTGPHRILRDYVRIHKLSMPVTNPQLCHRRRAAEIDSGKKGCTAIFAGFE